MATTTLPRPRKRDLPNRRNHATKARQSAKASPARGGGGGGEGGAAAGAIGNAMATAKRLSARLKTGLSRNCNAWSKMWIMRRATRAAAVLRIRRLSKTSLLYRKPIASHRPLQARRSPRVDGQRSESPLHLPAKVRRRHRPPRRRQLP